MSKYKLIDILVMISKGELKEGNYTIYNAELKQGKTKYLVLEVY